MAGTGELIAGLLEIADLGETHEHTPRDDLAAQAPFAGEVRRLGLDRAHAGQQGRDLNNKIVGAPGDFRAQAEQAFLNIKGALDAAGGGFEHVVKLTHYFMDLKAHFKMMRDIRLKYFDAARMPASTMIQVGALTDETALYEVDVVAVLPQG